MAITGEATPTATGKFEVFVDGELVHSKLGGQGFPTQSAQLQPILAAIQAKL